MSGATDEVQNLLLCAIQVLVLVNEHVIESTQLVRVWVLP